MFETKHSKLLKRVKSRNVGFRKVYDEQLVDIKMVEDLIKDKEAEIDEVTISIKALCVEGEILKKNNEALAELFGFGKVVDKTV